MSEDNNIDDVTLEADLKKLNESKDTPTPNENKSAGENPSAAPGDFVPGASIASSYNSAIDEYEKMLYPMWREGTNAFCADAGITDEQCHDLSKAFAPLLHKYMPDIQASVEINAGIAAATVFGPYLYKKFVTDKKINNAAP